MNDPDRAAQVSEGREIFRHETFGDERFWTDVLLNLRLTVREKADLVEYLKSI